MRNTLILVLVIAAFPLPAYSQESAGNWKAILNFSISGKYDMLPIVLSTYGTQNIVKPPPLPGLSLTSNNDDATLNVSVRSGNKYLQTSVVEPETICPEYDTGYSITKGEKVAYWELVLKSEMSDNINVEADLTNLDSKYKLLLIDPNLSEDRVKEYSVVHGNNQLSIPISQNATKTLYAIIGDAQSFVYSDSTGAVRGKVRIRGMEGINAEYDYSGVNVYVVELDGSLTLKDAADSEGSFEFSVMEPGAYTIQIVEDQLLSTRTDIVVPEIGHNFSVYQDLFGGNVINDAEVEFQDFKVLKKCYKLNSCLNSNEWENNLKDIYPDFTCSKANFDGDADANGCKEVNFSDFKILKIAYNRLYDPQNDIIGCKD